MSSISFSSFLSVPHQHPGSTLTGHALFGEKSLRYLTRYITSRIPGVAGSLHIHNPHASLPEGCVAGWKDCRLLLRAVV